MKASEIIAILAKSIDKYGDKSIIFNLGKVSNGIFYEPIAMAEAGRLFVYEGEKPKNKKEDRYIFFDLDLS